MPRSESAIYADFQRQRRLLVPMSLLLLFYEASGIQLDQITILGNTFRITNPSLVPVGLWVAWFYFGWRYYQYFRDLPDREFTTGWEGTTWHYIGRTVRATFCREFRRPGLAGKVSLPDQSSVTPTRMGPTGPWEFTLSASVVAVEPPRGQRTGGATGAQNERVVVPRWKIKLAKLRALGYVLLHTRLGTEFLLPFALAATPVLFWLYTLVRPLCRSTAHGC
jgi:hypothetical protein